MRAENVSEGRSYVKKRLSGCTVFVRFPGSGLKIYIYIAYIRICTSAGVSLR